jgi:hypothetical protein
MCSDEARTQLKIRDTVRVFAFEQMHRSMNQIWMCVWIEMQLNHLPFPGKSRNWYYGQLHLKTGKSKWKQTKRI